MLIGAVLLTLYGTSLNLAPVDFATVTGLYIATVFVMFQTANYIFFHIKPSPGVLVGGLLIVAGGMIAFIFRPAK
jgi:small multidrug resistance family-3 protein